MKSIATIGLFTVLLFSINEVFSDDISLIDQELQGEFTLFMNGSYNDPRKEMVIGVNAIILGFIEGIQSAIDKFSETDKEVLELGIQKVLEDIKIIKTKIDDLVTETELATITKAFFIETTNLFMNYFNDVLDNIHGKTTKTLTMDEVMNFLMKTTVEGFSAMERVENEDKELTIKGTKEALDTISRFHKSIGNLKLSTSFGENILDIYNTILSGIEEFTNVRLNQLLNE